MSGLFDASLPQSLYPTLPNVFAMQLQVKTTQGGNSDTGQTADGYAAAITVNVRRRPATTDELQRANLLGADNIVTFSVLNDGAYPNFMKPFPESRITDEQGVQWTVKTVTSKVLDTLFACVCVQGW